MSPGWTLPPLAAPLGVLTAHPRGVSSFPVMFFCKAFLLPLALRSYLFSETQSSKDMAVQAPHPISRTMTPYEQDSVFTLQDIRLLPGGLSMLLGVTVNWT